MKKSFIIFALSLCTIFGASAQASSSLRTGYFNDRIYTNHRLNPALVNDHNYLALPALGGIGFGVNSNLGLNDFLFPADTQGDELKSFLHPDISLSGFSSGIKDLNTINQSFDMTLFSLGFFGFGGFNTFDISLSESTEIALPGDMFTLLKGGQSSYDLSGLGVNAISYAEIAFGHSHKLNERLTIGVKLKALAGLAYADVKTSNTVLQMSDDIWSLSANASGEVAVMGAVIDMDENDELTYDEDNFTPSPAGYGGAIDLGATYDLCDNLTLSFAITDLGFIAWKNVSSIAIKGGEATLLDYNDSYDYDTAGDDIEDKLDGLLDEVEDMVEVQDVESGKSTNKWLSSTITLGAEYTILNDRISFGLLSTNRFGTTFFSELMGVVGVSPLKSLNISVSGSVSTNGSYWGCLFSFCPRGFINFYVGADSMISSVTPQLIPIKAANTNIRFGFAIPLGGKSSYMDKSFL